MPDHIEKLRGVAFLSFPGMADLLISELAERLNFSGTAVQYGDLLYYADYPDKTVIPYWCRTAMLEPFLLRFDSIGTAAKALRTVQRSWAPYQYRLFRRAGFIQEKLPYVNLKEREFPVSVPHSPIGLYTLIDEKSMIASAVTTSPFPAGTLQFVENHEDPPSRAYLKLQESLTMASYFFSVGLPHAGQRCFEAGACPGGWTWVLSSLGCSVVAVDRAELSPALMKNPLVQFTAHDAFTLSPEEIGTCDWVFSDVICYPERLLSWVKKWLASGCTENMICTIKMQGKINWNTVAEFAAIPDSRVLHLNYNRHELTWIHCGNRDHPTKLNGVA